MSFGITQFWIINFSSETCYNLNLFYLNDTFSFGLCYQKIRMDNLANIEFKIQSDGNLESISLYLSGIDDSVDEIESLRKM